MKKLDFIKYSLIGIVIISLAGCSNLSGKGVMKTVSTTFVLGGIARAGQDDDSKYTQDEIDQHRQEGAGLFALGLIMYYIANKMSDTKDSSSSNTTSSKEKESLKEKEESTYLDLSAEEFEYVKGSSGFLQNLDSTPTKGVSGAVILGIKDARCNKGARKVAALFPFCVMRNRNDATSAFAPKNACEEAEKGRKFLSLSMGKEVIKIKGVDYNKSKKGTSYKTNPRDIAGSIRKVIKEVETLPADCKR